MPDYRPNTAKAEWHLTYKCSLRCNGCSRMSWLRPSHTEDMTLGDAEEFIRQADEIGWRGFQPNKEKARILIIGGEPTLHPDFLAFVKMASVWSGTYVQVFSNGYGDRARELLSMAHSRYGASIFDLGFKRASVKTPGDYATAGWRLDMLVSPADAGLPSPPCYCHSAEICGLGVDHEGYSMCPIGASVRAIVGPPRTKRFADLFEMDSAERMTADECRHCGYEYHKRPLPQSVKEDWDRYVATCPTIQGCKMSPTWAAAMQDRPAKPDLE